MKKFEQVSSDDHQMSLAEAGGQVGGGFARSDVQWGLGPEDGTVTSSASWVMVT